MMLTDEQLLPHIDKMFVAMCDYCSQHEIEPRDGVKVMLAATVLLVESIKQVEKERAAQEKGTS